MPMNPTHKLLIYSFITGACLLGGCNAGAPVCEKFYTRIIEQKSFHPGSATLRNMSFDYAGRNESKRKSARDLGGWVGLALGLAGSYVLHRKVLRFL